VNRLAAENCMIPLYIYLKETALKTENKKGKTAK
jgi:hypothetical protein